MRFVLGRKIDLTYVSNRFAVTLSLLSLAFFFAYGEVTRIPVLENLYLCFVKTIVIFVTWAIGREIDPDQAGTANLASILVMIVLVLFPFIYPFLLAALFILIGTRVILRANGVKMEWLEFVAIALFVVFASVIYRFFLLELLLAAIFYLDYKLTPKNKNSITYAGIFVVGAMLLLVLMNFHYKLSLSLGDFILTSIVVEVYLAITYLRRAVNSTIDYGIKKMEKSRLMAARIWLLICVFVAVLFFGRAALIIDIAGFAVIVAFIINSFSLKFRQKFFHKKSGQ